MRLPPTHAPHLAPARFRRWPLIALACAALAGALAACGDDAPARTEESPIRLEPHPEGDAEIGEALIESYGCAVCHVIPGVDDGSHVGPPLTSFARREFIAGLIPNSADNLVLWILDPQSISPQTAMPNVSASPEEARHIAAFLATLD